MSKRYSGGFGDLPLHVLLLLLELFQLDLQAAVLRNEFVQHLCEARDFLVDRIDLVCIEAGEDRLLDLLLLLVADPSEPLELGVHLGHLLVHAVDLELQLRGLLLFLLQGALEPLVLVEDLLTRIYLLVLVRYALHLRVALDQLRLEALHKPLLLLPQLLVVLAQLLVDVFHVVLLLQTLLQLLHPLAVLFIQRLELLGLFLGLPQLLSQVVFLPPDGRRKLFVATGLLVEVFFQLVISVSR